MTIESRYHSLRCSFRTAAEKSRLDITSLKHPLVRAPDGGDLYIDIASYIPLQARAALVVVSGTHGIEGELGSWVQSEWLNQWRKSSDIAVMIVHLANPWGCAWARRVNEDNVDINRNFIDFARELPVNDGYANNWPSLELDRWYTDAQAELDLPVLSWAAKDGFEAVQAAITQGQYLRAEGLFFGGQAPCWSRTAITDHIASRLGHLSNVVLVDIHTGLGDYATHQIIVEAGQDSPHLEKIGQYVVSGSSGSVSAALSGTLSGMIGQEVGFPDYLGVVAEFGTLPPLDVLRALRIEHFAHFSPHPTKEQRDTASRLMQAAFAPSEEMWRETALHAALGVLNGFHSALTTTL
ncbi:DUF2817 domain-containing protein [Roseibium album]|uniref:DUF2817 domain-containing protein n=1 Tax=Roseibium album TaxID=311410 RepID=UPI00391C20C6